MTSHQTLELNRPNSYLLQAIFERNPDGMIIADDNCTCLEVNTAACKLLGLKRLELIGRCLTDFIELRCSLEQDGPNLVPTEVTRARCPLHRADGSLREVEYAIAVHYLPNLHLITLRDVSHSQADGAELLHQSQERFSHLVQTSSDWVWEINENQVYTYCSPKVVGILGYEPKEIIGKTPFDLMPDRERLRMTRAFRNIFHNYKPFYNLESIHFHQNGHLAIIETSGVPIFDLDGGFRGYRGISRDITDRKRVEKSLQERELQIASIANNIVCSIYRLVIHADQTVEMLFISSGLYEITGITPEVVMAEPEKLFTLIHPEDRAQCDRILQSAIASLQPFTNEFRLISASGQVKWVRDSARLSPLAEGGAVVDGVLIDISDRKQAEEALRQSENNLAEAQRLAHLGSWQYDLATGYTVWSDEVFRIFGLEVGQTIPSYRELLSKYGLRDVTKIAASLRQAVAEGKSFEIESEITRSDGTLRYLLVKGNPVFNLQEQVSQLFGMVLDITERKQTEAVMADLAAIVKFSDDAIIGMTLNGTITSWNLGAQFIYGYTPDEAIGKNIITLLVPRGDIGISGPDSKAAQDIIGYYTTPHLRKDGKIIEVLMTISPVKDAFGNITGSSVIARDISDRRAVERMKDEFISVVSHELRTPLTAIHGALGLLQTGNLGEFDGKGQRMLEIAVKNTKRLIRLTNDILDLESLESGKVKLSEENCDIADLIDQVVQELQPIADKARVTLSVSSISVKIFADSDRIIQVLTNLVSNAIKFSSPGKQVQLNVAIVGDRSLLPTSSRDTLLAQQGQKTLLVTVKDYGRGIPSDKLDSIFERFQQVDASDSRQKGGTGLGLAICRSIVQQHGGRIWAESIEDQGSSFFLSLPILPALDRPSP